MGSKNICMVHEEGRERCIFTCGGRVSDDVSDPADQGGGDALLLYPRGSPLMLLALLAAPVAAPVLMPVPMRRSKPGLDFDFLADLL
jgi:hypothetical protein